MTRLLILADMIDVQLLLKKLKRVENDLENLSKVSSQTELMESMQRFGISAKDLESQAGRRQQELMDPAMRDDLVEEKNFITGNRLCLTLFP